MEMTSYIRKKSLIFDRKLRIKFKSFEKKKKIYLYISKEVGKEVLIFLKKKNLVTLTFSLEDQLFLKKCQFFCLPMDESPVSLRAYAMNHSQPQPEWNSQLKSKSTQSVGQWKNPKAKAHKLCLLNPGKWLAVNPTGESHNTQAKSATNGKEANIFYYMIFNQFQRIFKKLEKKHLFFLTRKLPTSVKIKNYCLLTSNSRSVYRKVKLGRQSLKKEISLGFLPGFTKASF